MADKTATNALRSAPDINSQTEDVIPIKKGIYHMKKENRLLMNLD